MIGILGGYGEVGIHATRQLAKWNKLPIKIGGRNPKKAQEKFSKEFPDVTWESVNVEDDKGLEVFIQGCTVLVNCVGPSHKVSSRVAKLCISNHCHHIDAGIDQALEKMSSIETEVSIRYGAGTTPGLTGILPQWLAQEFDTVNSLVMYTGALDRFTTSGAEDYLVGVLEETNEPLAAWRDRKKKSSVLKRQSATTIPFFPREVAVFPFFDNESLYVAQQLNLINGDWNLVIDGTHVPEALNVVRSQFETDPKGAVERLCLAADLDLIGRQTYFNLIVQLDGQKNENSITRTAILQMDAMSVLTGTITALICISVLEDKVPSGIGPASELPNPEKIIDRLMTSGVVTEFKIVDTSIVALLEEVEGEI
ncbi:saccharopine dehydrogenase NADP-binding domain-containing protein [Aquimarina aquimarini]|uniref:saccharopine dehydrogenase NADP-binding domain-containing protein n=1 Tax=Aquimarina aquimarini TaxID=1191734 RepID=UPI000D55AE5A|nr:saccharopine dehydrogenase NADP-binding domain-containing protein [Aquimarina aquimarini]